MRVIAKVQGFYGGSRRRPGAVFEIPDGEKPGSWMKEYETGDQDLFTPILTATKPVALSESPDLDPPKQSFNEAMKKLKTTAPDKPKKRTRRRAAKKEE